jgi:hypothetical protein
MNPIKMSDILSAVKSHLGSEGNFTSQEMMIRVHETRRKVKGILNGERSPSSKKNPSARERRSHANKLRK